MTRSKEPNLQNIPIRTPEGRRISDAFRGPRHGSAMGSMLQAHLQRQNPPRLPPPPVMAAALWGLAVPNRVRGPLMPPTGGNSWKFYSGEPAYNELERRIMPPFGIDIHAELAKVLFGGPPEDAADAKARRSAAQSVGFNALYGGSKGDFFKNLRREAKT